MKHRSCQSLFAHWDEKRGRRALPERGEIDPAGLRAALGDTFILACNRLNGHTFRLAGTRVCALAGRELKGTGFLSLWDPADRPRAAELMRAAIDDSIGLVAAVHGTNADRQDIDLELLLLPLKHCGQSHLRMIGALAPLAVPYWLGASPVRALKLGEYRFVGHRASLQPFESGFVGAAAAPRLRRGFTVYDGGRN